VDITEIQDELESFKKRIDSVANTLNIASMRLNLKELENKTLEPDFWGNSSDTKVVLEGIKKQKVTVDNFDRANYMYENIHVMYMLVKEEEDKELKKEIEKGLENLKKEVELIEVETLLSGEYDNLNAIVTIHAGAGGTESQDWVQMLQRMYTKWSDAVHAELEIYDLQLGDEAGIKSVSFIIKTPYAYGYLKSEKGVHRLVRISPFDSNSRRHTSFAAVDVMPEIDETITLDIKSEELEIDTYRASGAGGQHINKTDSAIRIRHLPTGIVVTCQTERSQIQNKENAMRMLKSKLYQYELNKTQERLKEIKGELSENGWGSQIRSYVFCPYTLVKDHRTNFEVGNAQGVMDGDISGFITAYLEYDAKQNKE